MRRTAPAGSSTGPSFRSPARAGPACRSNRRRRPPGRVHATRAGNVQAVRVLNRLAVPAFDVLARWRGARAFHPRGALFAGRVELTGTSSTVTALGGCSEHPALVRISKGVGTRGSRRDLLGLAIRLTDLPDGPVDLLFSTVGRLPVTRAFFSVVSGWCARPYSTVLPYRADGVLVRLGLEPEEPHRARGTDPQAARAAVRRGPLQFTL